MAQNFNVLVSFGDGSLAMRRAAKRVVDQAAKFGVYDSTLQVTKRDLIKAFPVESQKINWSKPGLGWWAWKPLVLELALRNARVSNLPAEQISITYLDAGCWINATSCAKARLEDYHDQAISSGGLFFSSGENNSDHKYTKNELKGYLSGLPDSRLGEAQFAATAWLMRCDMAIEIQKEWWEICQQEDLVSDNFEPEFQHAAFSAHRNDQSALSLILKSRGFTPHQDVIDIHPAHTKIDDTVDCIPFWAARHRSGVNSLSMSLWRRGLTALEQSIP